MEESMIAYKPSGTLKQNTRVYLDGKHVGTIKPVTNGFAYFPLGSRTKGEVLPTIKDIQATLEEF